MTCSGRTQGAVDYLAYHTAYLWVVALRLLLVPELPVCVYLNYFENALQTKKWES